jgi:hypothetical protein
VENILGGMPTAESVDLKLCRELNRACHKHKALNRRATFEELARPFRALVDAAI